MYVDTSVRPQGEQVDAVAPAKMKLSAAIRIGAKIRPQCRGRFFSQGGSCALGAAWEGLGNEPFPENGNFYLQHQVKACDAMGVWQSAPDGKSTLYFAISRANDYGESRESIADWLESQGL